MFYYDRMMNNTSLTYRLYGRKFVDSDFKVGEDVKNAHSDENIILLPGSDKKIIQPILSDFIRNPLSVSVAHNWGAGDNGLAGIISNVRTKMSEFKSQITSLKDTSTVAIDEIVRMFDSLNDTVNGKDGASTLSAFANIQTIAASDYFRVFRGTEVSVPISLNCKLVYRSFLGKWMTPKEQLLRIIDYFMGPSAVDNKDNPSSMNVGAPHGYNSAGTNISNISGGLVLRWGDSITVRDLLLSDFNFSMSKEMLYLGRNKTPTSPMMIDVNFTLIPATIFTKQNVKDIADSSTSASYDGFSLNDSEEHYFGSDKFISKGR